MQAQWIKRYPKWHIYFTQMRWASKFRDHKFTALNVLAHLNINIGLAYPMTLINFELIHKGFRKHLDSHPSWCCKAFWNRMEYHIEQ